MGRRWRGHFRHARARFFESYCFTCGDFVQTLEGSFREWRRKKGLCCTTRVKISSRRSVIGNVLPFVTLEKWSLSDDRTERGKKGFLSRKRRRHRFQARTNNKRISKRDQWIRMTIRKKRNHRDSFQMHKKLLTASLSRHCEKANVRENGHDHKRRIKKVAQLSTNRATSQEKFAHKALLRFHFPPLSIRLVLIALNWARQA